MLSHQVGEDPEKNLAKIKLIANTNPAKWDGKLPTRGIRPDPSRCSFSEATRGRRIAPWSWYAKEKEPVPEAVRDLYRQLSFDFALVFQTNKAWVYVVVEPSKESMELLARQDHVKAFILISLINQSIPREQRENKRVRLGAAMGSKDVGRIFTFAAFPGGRPGLSSHTCGPADPQPRGAPVLQHRHLEHPPCQAGSHLRKPGGDRTGIGSRASTPRRSRNGLVIG